MNFIYFWRISNGQTSFWNVSNHKLKTNCSFCNHIIQRTDYSFINQPPGRAETKGMKNVLPSSDDIFSNSLVLVCGLDTRWRYIIMWSKPQLHGGLGSVVLLQLLQTNTHTAALNYMFDTIMSLQWSGNTDSPVRGCFTSYFHYLDILLLWRDQAPSVMFRVFALLPRSHFFTEGQSQLIFCPNYRTHARWPLNISSV